MDADTLMEQARLLADRSPSREAVFLLIGHAQNELMRGRMTSAQLRALGETLGVSSAEAERYSDEAFGVTNESD